MVFVNYFCLDIKKYIYGCAGVSSFKKYICSYKIYQAIISFSLYQTSFTWFFFVDKKTHKNCNTCSTWIAEVKYNNFALYYFYRRLNILIFVYNAEIYFLENLCTKMLSYITFLLLRNGFHSLAFQMIEQTMPSAMIIYSYFTTKV